jgi:biopolymer transport protein ExbD
VAQIVQGLRDGVWAPTDEVQGPGEDGWMALESHPQFADVIEEMDETPSRPHEDETRLDMNALIDVTLVLLIFFILTTTRSVAVQKIIPLPSVTDAKKGTKVYQADQVKKYMIRLQVVNSPDKGFEFRVEGQSADLLNADKKTLNKEKLAKLLQPLVRGQPPKTEMVLDAPDISWGLVVAIQDAAKSAGVRVVHHLHHP